MIVLADIAPALPRLTGDAVKVAVLLGALEGDEVIADAAAVRAFAKQLGLAVEVFRACIDELVRVGIFARFGRTRLTAGLACGGMHPALGKEGVGGDRANGAETSEQLELSESRSLPPVPTGSQGPRLAKQGASGATRSNTDHVDYTDRAREAGSTQSAKSEPAPNARGSGEIASTEDDDLAPWERRTMRRSPLQEVIATFDALYRTANDGAKPTWDGRQVNRLKALLQAHKPNEVIRRAQLMFTAPPPWPPPPHDLGTLIAHFDKFAKPGIPRGGVTDRGPVRPGYYSEDP